MVAIQAMFRSTVLAIGDAGELE